MSSVTSEYGKLRKVLLCNPDYYQWQPINETAKKTISEGQGFTIEDAQKQHQEFSEAFKSAGVEVLFIEPNKELPYQQYTRDTGVATRKGVLLGRFKEPVRQGETSRAEEFFTKHGIPILGRVSKGAIEGGDIHYIDNKTIACGLGARSDKEGIEEIREFEIQGHTYHCACRLVWGEGVCECGKGRRIIAVDMCKKEQDYNIQTNVNKLRNNLDICLWNPSIRRINHAAR